MIDKRNETNLNKATKSKKTNAKSEYDYLTAEYPNIWKKATDPEVKSIMLFADRYKSFLDTAKTEREVNRHAIEMAEKKGFSNICTSSELKTGDRVILPLGGTASFRYRKTSDDGWFQYFGSTHRFTASGSQTESSLRR